MNNFFSQLKDCIEKKEFVKLTLSDRRDKSNDLKNAFIKLVELKSGSKLSFVYRHATKDITKNFDLAESEKQLRELLATNFYKADLYTTSGDLHLTITDEGKIIVKKKSPTLTEIPDAEHNRIKKRFVTAENNIYLHRLGITSAEGKVKNDKQDKFIQINKFIEIIEGIVKSADLPVDFKVTDMGAGKGYLTFALYDYLTNTMNLKPEITGVEIRKELVESNSKIATEAGFNHLNFISGSIETTELPPTDMLIALHACDTATDQAIYRGIKAGAKIIICSPCCHKQLRKQMNVTNDLKAITKFGILEERQAEILTDTIRALIMEANGYKTNVFEFISTEHTPKNLMITGIKSDNKKVEREKYLEQIKNLKTLFNIRQHELEKLMGT